MLVGLEVLGSMPTAAGPCSPRLQPDFASLVATCCDSVFVDKRGGFDLRIGRYQRLIEIPRAVRRARQHDLVFRVLVQSRGI